MNNEELNKNIKYRKVKKIVVMTLCGTMLGATILLVKKDLHNSKVRPVNVTEAMERDAELSTTKIPVFKPTLKPTDEQLGKVPLNSENIDKIIETTLEEYAGKGITGVTAEMVRAALVFMNYDYLSSKEISEIYPNGFDSGTEINKMNSLISTLFYVDNNTSDNKAYGYFNRLVYNDIDKAILTEMDNKVLWLQMALRYGNVTGDKIEDFFNQLADFIENNGTIEANGMNIGKENLTNSGQYLINVYAPLIINLVQDTNALSPKEDAIAKRITSVPTNYALILYNYVNNTYNISETIDSKTK